MLRKPDGGSRGFGFVTFKDEMSVEKCLVMQHVLNGKQARALPAHLSLPLPVRSAWYFRGLPRTL